ncbi:MAG: aspartate kinase [Candidatus Acetothermia bacterium]
MGTIVKKFGGTSLQTKERIGLAVDDVIDSLEAGDHVTAVVSAMGREGDPYATDSLIGLLQEVSPDIDPMVQDLMMSNGEVISASVLAHHLRSRGYPAVPMTGFQAGIFTTGDFGDARITDVDPVRMERLLSEERPVVLAGFQGVTVRSEVTTLGRGGSDTTAVTVGGYLGADLVEIFTDVPGIAVVDPNLIDNPPFFSSVPREALLTLAENGATVIHPRAVKRAIAGDVPFSIKCAWEEGRETLVDGSPASPDTPLGIAMIDGLTGVRGNGERLRGSFNLQDAEGFLEIGGNEGVVLLDGRAGTGVGGDCEVSRGLSLVTAVSTRPEDTEELIEEIVGAISEEDYVGLERIDDGIRCLLPDGEAGRVIKTIYDLVY